MGEDDTDDTERDHGSTEDDTDQRQLLIREIRVIRDPNPCSLVVPVAPLLAQVLVLSG